MAACTIVLAIIITLATPFASAIHDEIEKDVGGFNSIVTGALAADAADSGNLASPELSISGSTLTITPVDDRVEKYIVEAGNAIIATFGPLYSPVTVDLSSVDRGTFIYVLAEAEGYLMSEVSVIEYRNLGGNVEVPDVSPIFPPD